MVTIVPENYRDLNHHGEAAVLVCRRLQKLPGRWDPADILLLQRDRRRGQPPGAQRAGDRRQGQLRLPRLWRCPQLILFIIIAIF